MIIAGLIDIFTTILLGSTKNPGIVGEFYYPPLSPMKRKSTVRRKIAMTEISARSCSRGYLAATVCPSLSLHTA